MRLLNRDLRAIWHDLVDRDTDRIIAGREPQNSDLAPLAGLINAWRSSSVVDFDEQFIADHAAVAVSAIAASGSAADQPGFVLRVRRRFSTAAAGLAMLAGFSGVAVASNGAVPGDWNYGIDRALEDFGIGVSEGERVNEVMELNDRGRSAEALQHASMLMNEDANDAAAALNSAADRITAQTGGAATSAGVRENVADLLRYLTENRGQVKGSDVAEKAKDIGGGPPTAPPGEREREREREFAGKAW